MAIKTPTLQVCSGLHQRYIFLKSPRFSSPTFFRSRSNRPGFLPNFFSLTLKKIEFLAQTPLIITFYCIFKLQFFEKCPKKLNFCPKIGKIRYVPVCFPIFVQMYRFLSPPPSAFLRNIYLCPFTKNKSHQHMKVR